MPQKVIIGLPEWNVGGPCVFAERLARGLAATGWDARVLLTEMNTSLVSERATPRAFPDDVQFDYLPAGKNDTWGMRWEALIRYLEEQAPCTYIINCDWRNSVVASRLSDRVRLIGMIHADYELEYSQIGRLGHYFNAIVAVSDPIQFNAAHQFPHLAPRMLTIRNAVPGLTEMPPKDDSGPLRICYSGELRRTQKRLDDLVRVAHGLEARNVDFELTFLGDGAMRAELEVQAQPLIERGRVRFAGRLPAGQILDELKKYHVFMLTSEFEGLSIALLEAMSRGCIPVVTDLATQSLVTRDGVNSYCVAVGDIETFVDRLTSLAHDKAKRKALGMAAFQTIIDGGYRVGDMLASYVSLFENIDAMVQHGSFVRERGWLYPPPPYIAGIGVLPMDDIGWQASYVNSHPLWPNHPHQKRKPVQISSPARNSEKLHRTTGRLEDYKVIMAIPSGQISGVDVFSTHLIRRLRQKGIDARIVGERLLNNELGLAIADDIPVEAPTARWDATWPMRWDAMVEYLEAQAPCIYLPNYDYEYSGICPRLSDKVKVIAIAHSDDPVHYEHVVRLGGASNAVVGVSNAIRKHIAGLDPTLVSRLHTIPYGVEPPPESVRKVSADDPLRIVFAGRLMTYQKQVQDLIYVALALDERNIPFELTIIGDGPEREHLQSLGRKFILDKRLWMPGKLTNDEVLKVLSENEIFLLPSTFEGLSVGLLEAMSRGLIPVVSNMRSGVPELIQDGVNGMIVPIGDIDGYAVRLTELYNDPVRRQHMARAAYETICSGGYRIEDMVGRYIDLFQSVINQPFSRVAGAVLPPDYMRHHLDWKVQTKYNLRHPRYWLRTMLKPKVRA